MAGFLLTYLTESLQKAPERVFAEADLSSRAEPAEIEDLVNSKILIRSQRSARGGGVSYRVDIDVIAKAISKAKRLKGLAAPVRLDPRLIFLGTDAVKAQLYAWFLAFADKDEEVAALLERRGGAYTRADRLVAVMPSEPVPTMTKRTGLRRKLDFMTLGELKLTDVRNEAVRRRILASTTGGIATSKIEKEIASFPCRVPVELSGLRTGAKNGLNIVVANGRTIHFGDTLFLLILRLVVGLFEKKGDGGYVSTSDFDVYEQSHLSADEIDRQVSRLRDHLRGSVEDVKQFIDRTRRGYVRLGVHPSFITFNRAKLIAHPNKPIRKLAERLPSN